MIIYLLFDITFFLGQQFKGREIVIKITIIQIKIIWPHPNNIFLELKKTIFHQFYITFFYFISPILYIFFFLFYFPWWIKLFLQNKSTWINNIIFVLQYWIAYIFFFFFCHHIGLLIRSKKTLDCLLTFQFWFFKNKKHFSFDYVESWIMLNMNFCEGWKIKRTLSFYSFVLWICIGVLIYMFSLICVPYWVG